MTRINSSEQVLLLLRAQLQHIQREKKLRKSTAVSKAPEGRPSPADRMQLIARLEALSDEERGRLFVTTVLTKEFGEEFANDPKFLSVSSQVYDALSRDEAGRALILDALGQMLDP